MSVYKFAINGEEHDIQGSGGEVQSPLTAGDGIEIDNDVISNTGVLSVNGEDGDVTIQIPTVNNGTLTITQNGTSKGTFSANQSGNATIELTDTTYTAGNGISITNNQINTTYTAGDGISITNDKIDTKVGTGLYIGDDYFAMTGPCKEGFHIPLKTEFDNLKTIFVTTFGLTASYDIAKTYLKMPVAGYYEYTSGNSLSYKNSRAYYWTSKSTSNGSGAYALVSYSTSFNITNIYYAYGCPIRPFKNEPVIPDNSWTVLYDGSSVATGAGAFWNATLGLISISGDGQTWITIADKNLGATVVYNDGDTLSGDNCGGYFQWGNNYMFLFTGIIDSTSNQTDASGYGPGNYYSDRSFRYGSQIWDTSRNKNLRGGETGVLNNVISNIGVRSINGYTGDITEENGIIINNIGGTTYKVQEEWVGDETQFNQLNSFGNVIYNVIE